MTLRSDQFVVVKDRKCSVCETLPPERVSVNHAQAVFIKGEHLGTFMCFPPSPACAIKHSRLFRGVVQSKPISSGKNDKPQLVTWARALCQCLLKG